MYDISNNALKIAEEMGADEAEVYSVRTRSTSTEIRKNEIESAKHATGKGIGIRALVDGAVGFASTNVMDHLNETVKLAVDAARVRKGDSDWKGLPSPGKYPRIKGIYDKKIENMGLEECISFTKDMIDGALSQPDIIATSGAFSTSVGENLIMNTNGVEVLDSGTAVSGFIDVITTNDDVSTAYDFRISRKLDVDLFNTGKNATDLALSSANGIKVEAARSDVILHPFAFSDILENTFARSIDADNVQKDRSFLSGKIGETIASENLSVIDDGTLEGGLESSASDDEGHPSQRTGVITNGVFNSYLYDSYTAGKEGIESTGNGTRNSYTSTPSVGLRNLVIDHPGSDIIAQTSRGVFVNTVIGAHTANSISGDFSVEARNAFTIKDGQLDKPIKSLMISGNIFDMLKNITGAGKDIMKVGGIVTPAVKIENMSIIG